jgi:hypothetical protein
MTIFCPVISRIGKLSCEITSGNKNTYASFPISRKKKHANIQAMIRILKPITIENHMSFRAARYSSLSMYCVIFLVHIYTDSGKMILNKSLFIKAKKERPNNGVL